MNEIKPGLYEAIITQRLSDALKVSGLEHERSKLGKDDAPALLAQFLNALTLQTLESVDEDDARTKQLEVGALRGQAVPTHSMNQKIAAYRSVLVQHPKGTA